MDSESFYFKSEALDHVSIVVYKHVDQLKVQKYTLTFGVYLLFLTKLMVEESYSNLGFNSFTNLVCLFRNYSLL